MNTLKEYCFKFMYLNKENKNKNDPIIFFKKESLFDNRMHKKS